MSMKKLMVMPTRRNGLNIPPLKDRLNQYALFRGIIKDTEATHTIDPM